MADPAEILQDPSRTDSVVATDGDSRSKLEDLKAQATLKYSVKDYNAAAELYSYAVELQDEINGEMSSENADLLYAYGRCLYHLAIKNSDVLGSKVAGEKREEKPTGSKSKKVKREHMPEATDGQEQKVVEEIVAQVVEEKEGIVKPEEDAEKESKPYFQFKGDENWDTSDDEDDDGEEDREGGEDADEEDDFANAYEVLDMARVLLQKKIAEAEDSSGKGKEKGENIELRQLKERLADTYDLQAEISLEGERFPAAVVDLKSALQLKRALFPQESSLLAEAHYKLSLSLEFSSVTQQKNENGDVEPGTEAQVDDAMREEAAQEMEAAIASCKLRIQKEESKLLNSAQTNGDASKPKVTRADIDDVKEMVKDMEQRLTELRQPPVSINDPTGLGTLDGSHPLSGILGQVLGESPEAQKKRIEEASKGANDLTGMVKKKKPAPTNEGSKAGETAVMQTNGKRKVDFAEEVEEVGTGKKVKVTDGDEE
ncbi:HAT1-interacting factor 1, partial [Lecanoromycetidae sp. Uapishka_2]